MSKNSLQFGTSGLRGLVVDLDGAPAYAYSLAFVRIMQKLGDAGVGRIFLGRDLRASSPSIASRVAAAIAAAGLETVDCGALPTPALAHAAMRADCPAIMVTGSHIPEERNGLKFYRPDGEIDKADEQAILAELEGLGETEKASVLTAGTIVSTDALDAYRARYAAFFDPGCLAGWRIGVYQHSSVARDLLCDFISMLGGEPVPLGRADRFVAVDTEALRPDDVAAAAKWAAGGEFNAIVSTDGDADRPLIADEKGQFLKGDLVGALTARYVGADCVVTPVTSNSSLDKSFEDVVRTRVGSPHVIAGMASAAQRSARCIVGFEANGGVLLGSDLDLRGKKLQALPTRDAVLPILSVLAGAREAGASVADIAGAIAFRATAANRLKDTPSALSTRFMQRLAADAGWASEILGITAPIDSVSIIDGVRIMWTNGEVVHYRASGNAPELRCYVEAGDPDRASELLARGLEAARQQIQEYAET